MSNLKATKRENTSSSSTNKLRATGFIPAILYGGKDPNQKISIEKKAVRDIIKSDNFLSKVLELDVEGKKEKVLPRDVAYHVVSEEPIHIDFMRVVSGKKIVLEIPVKFINHPDSPGLKRGGVLNIVRRKVELKCPTENIPTELIVDLEGLDIGSSIKISSIKLPEKVTPTIQGRDFVVATVAITKSLSVIVGTMFSPNFTEEIFKLVPISVPVKSIVMSSGIFSAGHFNSTILLTIFRTPPLFSPGESGWLINLTGISRTIFLPDTTLMKSIWIGSSETTW